MRSSSGQALVLGAGHNGLAAAIALAQAGHPVTVLERRDVAGGVSAIEEFHPGFCVPGIQHGTFGVRRRVVDELGLANFGLRLLDRPAALFTPELEGAGLVFRPGDDELPGELSTRSSEDATAWDKWRKELKPLRRVIDALIDVAPPELEAAGWSTLLQLAKPSLAFRLLGANAMGRILRSAPMCAEDLLNDTFSDALLRAYLASRGIEGALLGPRSAGSGALLLLRELASGPGVAGGPSAFTDALVAAAQAAGVAFEFNAEVTDLVVEAGSIQSVRTSDERIFEAELVLSGLGAKQTFAACSGVIPVRKRRAAERVRARGTTAAVRLALSAPLRFRGRENEAFEFARVLTNTVDLERAFDSTKHRELTEQPWLDIAIASETNASFAPEGKASVSILIHNAPHNLEGGWTLERRSQLLKLALRRLAPHVPDLENQIVGSQVLSPADLESQFGLDGGHPMHAELGLDQLWVQRPSVHLARYETGINGLFLAGRSSHPGGEFLGSSGLLAGQAALAQK